MGVSSISSCGRSGDASLGRPFRRCCGSLSIGVMPLEAFVSTNWGVLLFFIFVLQACPK